MPARPMASHRPPHEELVPLKAQEEGQGGPSGQLDAAGVSLGGQVIMRRPEAGGGSGSIQGEQTGRGAAALGPTVAPALALAAGGTTVPHLPGG